MATTRTSAMRASKQLRNHSLPIRQLHMTGAATASPRLFSADKPLTTTLSDPHKGGNSAEASQTDYIRFLTTAAHASPNRPTPSAPSPTRTRRFNTSRTLKAVKDSSTIDFAYLPDFPAVEEEPGNDTLRVPLLPTDSHGDGVAPMRSAAELASTHGAGEAEVLAPTISTTAHASTHHSVPSAMSEVHDNAAHPVDFHEVSDALSHAARNVGDSVKKEGEIAGGVVRQFWKGLVDDVFGAKKSGSST